MYTELQNKFLKILESDNKEEVDTIYNSLSEEDKNKIKNMHDHSSTFTSNIYSAANRHLKDETIKPPLPDHEIFKPYLSHLMNRISISNQGVDNYPAIKNIKNRASEQSDIIKKLANAKYNSFMKNYGDIVEVKQSDKEERKGSIDKFMYGLDLEDYKNSTKNTKDLHRINEFFKVIKGDKDLENHFFNKLNEVLTEKHAKNIDTFETDSSPSYHRALLYKEITRLAGEHEEHTDKFLDIISNALNIPAGKLTKIKQDSQFGGIDEVVKKVGEYATGLRDINFSTESEKHYDLKHLVKELGGAVPYSELKKMGYDLPNMGYNIKSSKDIITPETIDNHIETLPKQNLEVAHNTYNGNQQHSYNQKNLVKQFNLTPEKINELKKVPGSYELFKKINKMSEQSGHPVGSDTVGWVRYSQDDSGTHIDEIQTDFSDKTFKYEMDGGSPEVVNAIEHFNKTVWGGDHPSKVLHSGFLQHLRESGHANKPVHLWQDKIKAEIAGMDANKPLPTHMSEGYKKQPKKMGYKPSSYGDLPVQDNEEFHGYETWKKVLRKANNKV